MLVAADTVQMPHAADLASGYVAPTDGHHSLSLGTPPVPVIGIGRSAGLGSVTSDRIRQKNPIHAGEHYFPVAVRRANRDRTSVPGLNVNSHGAA